jgi:hypothetical protein
MAEFFKKLLQSRYVGLLEGEVLRLRAENRALTNSLLGTAGFPPVDFPEAPKMAELPRARRRSWHQIQAFREAESARNSSTNLDASGALVGADPLPRTGRSKS